MSSKAISRSTLALELESETRVRGLSSAEAQVLAELVAPRNVGVLSALNRVSDLTIPSR